MKTGSQRWRKVSTSQHAWESAALSLNCLVNDSEVGGISVSGIQWPHNWSSQRARDTYESMRPECLVGTLMPSKCGSEAGMRQVGFDDFDGRLQSLIVDCQRRIISPFAEQTSSHLLGAGS